MLKRFAVSRRGLIAGAAVGGGLLVAWGLMPRNFEVPLGVSILCGALNLQIEHHLFPRLPPHRLRELAPRVRALCEAHGIRYRTAGWGSTLREVLARLRELGAADSRPMTSGVGARAQARAGGPRDGESHHACSASLAPQQT